MYLTELLFCDKRKFKQFNMAFTDETDKNKQVRLTL